MNGEAGGAGPTRFADPMVARYAREILADKAGHLALTGVAAGGRSRAADLDGALGRLASMASLSSPEGFDPYADDGGFLLAAHMLETACSAVSAAAAPRGRAHAGPLTPVFTDAAYHAGLIRTAIAARAPAHPEEAAAAARVTVAFERLADGVREGRGEAARRLLLGAAPRRGRLFALPGGSLRA